MVDRCASCGSIQRFTDPTTGDLVCNDCGLVAQDGAASSLGLPTPAESLKTGIEFGKPRMTLMSRSGKNAFTKVNARLRWTHTRERRFAGSSRNREDRMIDYYAGRLGVPPFVAERAKENHEKARRAGVGRGRTMETFCVALLVNAARAAGIQVSVRKAHRDSLVKDSQHHLFSSLRDLKRAGFATPFQTPTGYIQRFAPALGFRGIHRDEASAIAEETMRRPGFRGSPVGTAAACLYLVSVKHGLLRSQEEISALLGCTSMTLRDTVNAIKDNGWTSKGWNPRPA